MKLQINKEWRIRTDELQYIVERGRVFKSGKRAGEETWEALEYHPTLELALNSMFERRLRLSEAKSLQEAVRDAKALHNEIQKALNPNFDTTGGNHD